MEAKQILNELKSLGSAQTAKVFRRHGAPEDLFGVKVGDLKPIAKRLTGEQGLALQLWDTGNSDAMYLASLVANGALMTVGQLNHWAQTASWYMLSEYAVPFVASEHDRAVGLAMRWIKSRQENVASSGWATYAAVVSTRPDGDLDLAQIRGLLSQVEPQLGNSKNRVRYTMNGFVIAVGAYVAPLLTEAKRVAQRIGKVHVDVGNTSCKVPPALDYIAKIEAMGRIGRKRKTARC